MNMPELIENEPQVNETQQVKMNNLSDKQTCFQIDILHFWGVSEADCT